VERTFSADIDRVIAPLRKRKEGFFPLELLGVDR